MAFSNCIINVLNVKTKALMVIPSLQILISKEHDDPEVFYSCSTTYIYQ